MFVSECLWCQVPSQEGLYEWDMQPIKIKKKKSCTWKQNPTGVCLVVAVGLTQDLTLILSTKKHRTKQKKKVQKLRKNNKNSSTANVSGEERDSLWRICATASNNILESAIWEEDICCVLLPASLWRYAVCYCQLHCEEYMLCVAASLIMKKICCVLFPASLWRRYSCLLL